LGGQKDVHGIASELFLGPFCLEMHLKNHFFFKEELFEGLFMQEETAHTST
jgi:hypothetical protein